MTALLKRCPEFHLPWSFMTEMHQMTKDSIPQKEADHFHMMVGYCIAEWAKVDDELFRIFRDCVGPPDQSAIIYYRTPGLSVRLALTEEIVKSVLPRAARNSGGHDDPRLTTWKAVADDFRDGPGARGGEDTR